jgi:hypothetical protein
MPPRPNCCARNWRPKPTITPIYLAEILAVPVWDFDDEQIEKIGAGFTRNELVDELHIYNSEHHTLYSYQDEGAADDRIKRTAAIDRNGKAIGVVEFHLSLGAFQSTLVLIRNSMTLVLATSLIVILITTGLLLHYFIRNPIDSLQKGLDRVAKGDYQYDFHDVHYAELSGISIAHQGNGAPHRTKRALLVRYEQRAQTGNIHQKKRGVRKNQARKEIAASQ